jgi:hypothetical protein
VKLIDELGKNWRIKTMPTLYGAPASPFVRKTMAALAEKGIAYEHDPVIPFNPPAATKSPIEPEGERQPASLANLLASIRAGCDQNFETLGL